MRILHKNQSMGFLYAIKYLSVEEEVNVNATCITSFLQASIACSSGAKILSYFWGKMTDEGIDPVDHVSSLKKFITFCSLMSIRSFLVP